MILNDTQIIQTCGDGFVFPFDESLANPASLDIRLGTEIMIESAAQRAMVRLSLTDARYSEECPYHLKSNEFILASSLETFNFPRTIAGQFLLKSSLMREGLNCSNAGWCDPGWHGSQLTIGLKNMRQLHSVQLWPGRKIGQLILHEIDPPANDYAKVGRYNNSKGVALSLGAA